MTWNLDEEMLVNLKNLDAMDETGGYVLPKNRLMLVHVAMHSVDHPYLISIE